MEGYVYILVNSSLPNLIKIGRTTKEPNIRAAELSGTGTPGRFVVAYSVLVKNCVEIEAEMHSIFSKERHTNDREFFDLEAPIAIDKLNEISIDKKISNNSISQGSEEVSAVLYLAKITDFANVHRIGLLKKSHHFLDTQEFKDMILELYQTLDSNILLGDIVIMDFKEFDYVDTDAFNKMQSLIDAHLVREKNKNSSIFFNRFDKRTLDYKINLEPSPTSIFKSTLSFNLEPSPTSIFKSTLSFLEPIAKASMKQNAKVAIDDEEKAKERRIQMYKQLGL